MAIRIAGVALPILAAALIGWRYHPIHAARLELDAAPDGAVTATVHLYRADLPATIQLPDLGAYLGRVLVVTDVRATRVILRAMTMAPEGDRVRVDLTGHAAAALSGGRIAVTLLQEKFSDQVNVVDARIAGHRAQLVFLRGDKPQALP